MGATERFYIDGVRVTRGEYAVSGLDEGLLLGLTVFETMRTYGGCLFRLPSHVHRLLHSVEVVGVPCPGGEALTSELRQSVSGFGSEARLRFTLTMGGRRLLHVTALVPETVCAPLSVTTLRWEPSPWLDGRVKHGSRALGEVARRGAGTDEVLWVGSDGCITEGARSSVFGVIGAVIVTPPDDGRILPGITRQALLDAGRAAGLPVTEAAMPADAPFTELYASSTLKELAPIVLLDGCPAPGRGPLGERLLEAFHSLVVAECGAP